MQVVIHLLQLDIKLGWEGVSVAINKDYVKKKVAQAIKQMPSVGIVVREKYSKYK